MSREAKVFLRYAFAVSTVVSVGSLLAPSHASATVGQPVRAGDAVVVASSNGSRELTHGQSASEFSLRLPDGAACPGDSANDQWRFQSFLIPGSDVPSAVHYGVMGPEGPGQWALYQVNTSPLVDSLTNQNSGPGNPGVIPAIPSLSFAVFTSDLLPSGRYRIGIACTLSRQTAKYWDTELVFSSSAGDKPGGFVWRLPTEPESINDPNHGPGRWWLLPVIFVVGAIALSSLWFYRGTRASNKSFTTVSSNRKGQCLQGAAMNPDSNQPPRTQNSRRADHLAPGEQ